MISQRAHNETVIDEQIIIDRIMGKIRIVWRHLCQNPISQ